MKDKPSIPGGLKSIKDSLAKLESLRTGLVGTKNRKRRDQGKKKKTNRVKNSDRNGKGT
jgi:hypothetical protein